MTYAEMTCTFEDERLSPLAAHSRDTRGRMLPLSECDMRTEYQRDRDRILHSKSFRRLMHKTQVFLAPEADHYRTRLTHTLEVTQIGRTIARAARLNEDLTEAIGLGHDLGHTPFGHAGERVLQRCCDLGFTHYGQSLRVVDVLEGLNLTHEVRNGIYCHTNGVAETLEGQLVRLADRIAYINHDIDDACRAGVLSIDAIPAELRHTLGETHGLRIDRMVRSTVSYFERENSIGMEKEIAEATEELHRFLGTSVYTNPLAKGEEGKAEAMLEKLFITFRETPSLLPAEYREIAESESVDRAVCDYISGMTDRYAISIYKKLFIPETWR